MTDKTARAIIGERDALAKAGQALMNALNAYESSIMFGNDSDFLKARRLMAKALKKYQENKERR